MKTTEGVHCTSSSSSASPSLSSGIHDYSNVDTSIDSLKRHSNNHNNNKVASELFLSHAKQEKMQRSLPNLSTRVAHMRTVLKALVLRGDYVSCKVGGSHGIVVASGISYSPALIAFVFLMIYPLSFHWMLLWVGALLVSAFGSVVHAAASALGVGYGFNPELSLCSFLAGASATSAFRIWNNSLGSYADAYVAFLAMVSTFIVGLYTFRETAVILAKRFAHSEGASPKGRKALFYPVRLLGEHVVDILQSPPLSGRHRGDQYYINEANMKTSNAPSGPKFADVVGVHSPSSLALSQLYSWVFLDLGASSCLCPQFHATLAASAQISLDPNVVGTP
eukprot:jgi/Bigna1/83788/fgenesh1_pg.115_\